MLKLRINNLRNNKIIEKLNKEKEEEVLKLETQLYSLSKNHLNLKEQLEEMSE